VKITVLIFALICFSVPLTEPVHADPRSTSLPQSSAVSSPKAAINSAGVEQTAAADDAKQQTNRTRSDGRRDSLGIPPKRVTAGHSSTNQPNRLPRPSSNVRRSTPAITANRRQPASANSGVATNGPFQNKGTGSVVRARHPSVVRSNATPTSPNIVRHRGANPAVVGALGNTNSRNAGTLDGARMSRKP
jgi:hypothetical protein